MGLFGGSSKKKKEEKNKPKATGKNQPAQNAGGAAAATAKPAEEPMDDDKLVRIAATFLANPKIEKESLELKTAFLRRKGLNDVLIKSGRNIGGLLLSG